MAQMDAAGPDKIESELDEWVDKMAQSAGEWTGIKRTFVFARIPCKLLIEYAIVRCRRLKQESHNAPRN